MLRTAPEIIGRLRIVATVAPQPVDIVAETPDGPAVELSQYRDEMATSRLESVGQPGVWLDCGPTGAGKSTADQAAFAVAGRSLSVQPTHSNCADVVRDCLAVRIDAAAYPGRYSRGEKRNCWNPAADAAEAMGLCAVAAVCNAGCEHRRQCLESGYLGGVAAANAARVAVATHARATHTGLTALAEGRSYVSIHEGCLLDILTPQLDVDAVDLQAAQAVLNRLLTDPDWLDRFGEAYTLDADGEWSPDDRRTERRDRQYQFVRHLADTVDRLIALAAATDGSAEIPVADTLAEPPGVQPLLFEACRELAADFRDRPVWPLLFYAATGEFYRQGILIDGHNNADETEPSGRQSDLPDTPQPAAAGVDCVAV